MTNKIRINRYLAGAGLGSRRKCEKFILNGSVKVNGNPVNRLSLKVEPEKDIVVFDGKEIKYKQEKTLLVLNKPAGVLSSASDNRGRKTVIDIAREEGYSERLYPVGRLDIDTTGVILLTDDGDLAYRLTHPKHEIPKIYQVRVKGKIGRNDLRNVSGGIDIGGYITAPCKVETKRISSKFSDIEVTIREGKNRQIKRMFDAIGHKVISLNRKSIGGLEFDNLKIGEIRTLSESEENLLREKTGVTIKENK
ncbi:MAG: pseudouridine synthase [Candidatus Krumholzibacteriota bacterium]|nr:pseudouridine synthase [Candidatus Krumholzibacteriota bacterium]